MKTKVLRLDQVLLDNETYPRMHYDFVTKARYYNAMKSGDIFPPICVALLDGKYYLVDGNHRLLATKDLGTTEHISAEVLKVKTKEEIFVEAIKRNIGHGKQFTTQEVTQIIITLEEWDMSVEAVSKIVRIPSDEIKPFVAKRMVSIYGDNGEQENHALKSTLKHLAGTTQESGLIPEQMQYSGSQIGLLSTLISLIENNHLNLEREEVVKLVMKLNELTNGLVLTFAKTVKKKSKGKK